MYVYVYVNANANANANADRKMYVDDSGEDWDVANECLHLASGCGMSSYGNTGIGLISD